MRDSLFHRGTFFAYNIKILSVEDSRLEVTGNYKGDSIE